MRQIKSALFGPAVGDALPSIGNVLGKYDDIDDLAEDWQKKIRLKPDILFHIAEFHKIYGIPAIKNSQSFVRDKHLPLP